MNNQPEAPTADRGLQKMVAIGVLVAFTILFLYMISHADDRSQVTWTRLTYLFAAAEAIAFTVVGWIFGREVNRERAEAAETAAASQAESATQAVEAKASAETRLGAVVDNAYALADAIRSSGTPSRSGPEVLGGGGGGSPSSTPSTSDLRTLANALFPPR